MPRGEVSGRTKVLGSMWRQPVCDDCWRMVEGEKAPMRLVDPPQETCALCGSSTSSGVYIRLDPRVVPFPGDRV